MHTETVLRRIYAHLISDVVRRISTAFVLTLSFLLTAVISVPAATYTGTNTGAIADGTGGQVNCGAARNINFAVAGFPGQIGGVSVSFTMNPQHTWVGDLDVLLIAPNATAHRLFSRVGATTATGNGDNANLGGTYVFNDLATSNIWTVAASSNNNNFVVTNGSYRTQTAGPGANVSPGPGFTSMNPIFAAMPAGSANGNWTLRFLDCSAGDTGTVSAAALSLFPLSAGSASISGDVVTAWGAGIRNAVVTVSGGNIRGKLTTVTGTFGHYQFDGLDVGQSYVITVSAKRYAFEKPSMFVNLDDNVGDLDFVANE